MKKLYHYTDSKAFESITSSRSFRMTRSDCFSDPYDTSLFILLVDRFLKSRNFDELFVALDNECVVRDLCFNRGCGLLNYIRFIYDHIPIYVLSFSNSSDKLVMWERMGLMDEGRELILYENNLIFSIRNMLSLNDEYIAVADVIYVDDNMDICDILIPNLSEFKLYNHNTTNIFSDGRLRFINHTNNGDSPSDPYQLIVFLYTFYKDYLMTLDFLSKSSDPAVFSSMSPDQIFSAVYQNVFDVYGSMLWKKELSLYLIVLAALLKQGSYRFEDERRVFYFNFNINTTMKKEFDAPRIGPSGGVINRKYILFDNLDMVSALNGVIIDPIIKVKGCDRDRYKQDVVDFLTRNGYKLDATKVWYSNRDLRWR